MKKNNKPAGLLIALGVFVLAAAGINGFQNGTFKLSAPTDSGPGEARKTEQSTEDLAKDTRDKLAQLSPAKTVAETANPAGGKMNQQAEMMLKARNGRPFMAIDKPGTVKMMKPKPNDSSISTQWYNDESRPE
ncbi:hypothetical protein EON81_09755 [bacterium]|nr:MAG: hypothetical protein EON81_09755 [bacterium]